MEPLRFAVLSDIHMTGSPFRRLYFKSALKQIQKTSPSYRLFVSLGDTTDHGYPQHWDAAAECLENARPAPECIAALGNHDTWNKDPRYDSEYEASLPLYLQFRSRICGVDDAKPYHYQVIGETPFIVLGAESDSVGGVMTDEQFCWLAVRLEEASKLQTFIFVVSHFAFKNTHGLPVTFGEKVLNENKSTWGDRDGELRALIGKYKNVIYLTGHSHMGWTPSGTKRGYASVETHDGVTCVNAPCFMFLNHDGAVNRPGLGVEFIMDGDTVTLCPVDYALGRKLKKYRIVITKQ